MFRLKIASLFRVGNVLKGIDSWRTWLRVGILLPIETTQVNHCMPTINRSALLPYSSDSLFDLVNDVASYPEYLSGCQHVEVIESTDEQLEARLYLSKAGIKQSFTTRNTLERPNTMVLHLVDGPFKQFEGRWDFKSLAPDATKISLSLSFELSSGLLSMAAGKLFEMTANDLLDAIVRRAHQTLK